ncbi:SIR2 family NAD-dependent protein deacylase [Herbiconiux sp. SYSU D00978]|uniref:hypothetical protein n=1 Tax=Herbiconiux sp. SYSU D00978 TaxID=2812562 RepID=UPI001A9575DE|nr:hypothetical protein [Herbiconiux sp. SYSU D00978]
MRHHQQSLPQLAAGELDQDQALDAIHTADRVLIGAGAGLSAAAGYDYTDRERFRELFPALSAAGFTARYQLIGYPLPPRHMWGYWATHVNDIRLGDRPNALYQALRSAVGDREHFVMSSNVDALFTRNGFASESVYTPQGDYALYQCLEPCTRSVWDARGIVAHVLENYDPLTGQTSEDAVPSCPNCGGEVFLNVFAGSWYINDHFQPQLDSLNDWLTDTRDSGESLAIVEIGSGFNTPSVIRWPIEHIATLIPRATLIRVNRDHPGVPASLTGRAASLGGDAGDIINRLITAVERPSA